MDNHDFSNICKNVESAYLDLQLVITDRFCTQYSLNLSVAKFSMKIVKLGVVLNTNMLCTYAKKLVKEIFIIMKMLDAAPIVCN